MSNKEAVREFKKGLIIVAASQLFREQSYEEITVQDIADAAEIGKATLYQYFSSKEEILFELMLKSAEETNLLIENSCLNQADPKQALENLIYQTYQMYLSHNRLFLSYLALKLHGSLKPEWLHEMRKRRDHKFNIFSQLLDKGISEGVFIQADSRHLARVLNNILRGFSLEFLEASQKDNEPIKELDLDLIRSVLFRGILADGGGETGE